MKVTMDYFTSLFIAGLLRLMAPVDTQVSLTGNNYVTRYKHEGRDYVISITQRLFQTKTKLPFFSHNSYDYGVETMVIKNNVVLDKSMEILPTPCSNYFHRSRLAHSLLAAIVIRRITNKQLQNLE